MATATPFIPQASTTRHPHARAGRFGRPIVPMQAVVRRRGSAQQGQALEVLGHALEYLEDSRMFMSGTGTAKADAEAISMLRRASREVFLECPVVLPLRERVGRWVAASLFGVS